MTATTIERLRLLDIGYSVAEHDTGLSRYFVETQIYDDFCSGKYDIVVGEKGSGKSAIYKVLRENAKLKSRNGDVFIVPGFNDQGAPIFRRLMDIDHKDVGINRGMWKMHAFAVAANFLADQAIAQKEEFPAEILSALETNGLREANGTIDGAWNKLRAFFKKATFKYKGKGVSVDVEFAKASAGLESLEEQIDILMAQLNKYLVARGHHVWILFDRLDESFIDHPDKEVPALSGLCRAYLDFLGLTNLKLKMFFRRDLYRKIADAQFVNLTHLEAKSIAIEWGDEDLIALLCARVRKCHDLMKECGFSKDTKDATILNAIFPEQVDVGERKPTTVRWMLNRIEDGLGVRAPRNLIDLVNLSKETQIAKEQRDRQGGKRRKALIEPDSLKIGLERLSVKRVTDTLRAEMGAASQYLDKFKGAKAEHNKKSIGELLGKKGGELEKAIGELKASGFISVSGDNIKIPMLYRDGLEITQGKAF